MPSTYTVNVGLAIPALNEPAWNATLDANRAMLDALGSVGPLCVDVAQHPSTTLNVRVAAGSYQKADGTLASYAGTSSFGCTASQTNSVYLTDAGVLTKATTGFPAGNIVRLAVVIAGSTTVTSVADARVPWQSFGAAGSYLPLAGGHLTGALTVDAGGLTVTLGGLTVSAGGITLAAGNVALSDAVNLTAGSSTGTKFATAASQKLGWWNATPIVQPSGSAQAALTNSTGASPITTINDAGGSYTQATLNNNFSSIVNLLNAIRTALVAAGLMKGSA